MSLSPAFLDELRARTRISQVIGQDVKLIRAGKEYKACCPFHNEKTPSFTVNDEKQFYHCFGCGAHGDAIRYLTDARGLGFMDAVKELAGKAGMEVPAPDPRAQERAERRAGLVDVTEAAATWFREQLGGIEGAGARAYLDRRGLTKETIAKFGLGFAPDTRGKLKAALSRFGNDKLIESGMLIRPDDREPYDRFRGRLMIPIRDPRGRTIAFGGRIIGEGEPKYLNSPETPLFDKGRQLYNLDLAAAACRKSGRILVVEGYMDVIALDQAGIGEAVAPLGTALTEGQLQLLWRLSDAPILCFDGDAAGRNAAIRAAERALPMLGPQRSLAFVELPTGKDPDDLVKEGGKEAFEALLAKAEPLVERLWRHERDAAPLTTPEARAGLKQRLFQHAKSIEDGSLSQLYREEWLARFDALLGRGQGAATPRWQKKGGRWTPPPPPASAAVKDISRVGIGGPQVAALLRGYALYPEAIAESVETLAALPIADPLLARTRDRLVDAAFSGESLDREAIATILAADGLGGPPRPSMGFSFTRPESDAPTARRDLGLALEAIAATAEIELALDEATKRLAGGDADAFAEQQKYHAARAEMNDRLASLAIGD
ncbi:DNA primase [Sphingomicrobium lutaoense]|uniref:DNA primase n=1 Tax=Sphingomicrobium lutaoense TaxID=515949 RepID=A0A839YX03_9SPHN|nr:DNA primase [Sphingomicrobium lutaoense]MBB3763719.1 DNA primase [Sphingomicrobium lutaoense]